VKEKLVQVIPEMELLRDLQRSDWSQNSERNISFS
jgi:hypothetical protein